MKKTNIIYSILLLSLCVDLDSSQEVPKATQTESQLLLKFQQKLKKSREQSRIKSQRTIKTINNQESAGERVKKELKTSPKTETINSKSSQSFISKILGKTRRKRQKRKVIEKLSSDKLEEMIKQIIEDDGQVIYFKFEGIIDDANSKLVCLRKSQIEGSNMSDLIKGYLDRFVPAGTQKSTYDEIMKKSRIFSKTSMKDEKVARLLHKVTHNSKNEIYLQKTIKKEIQSDVKTLNKETQSLKALTNLYTKEQLAKLQFEKERNQYLATLLKFMNDDNREKIREFAGQIQNMKDLPSLRILIKSIVKQIQMLNRRQMRRFRRKKSGTGKKPEQTRQALKRSSGQASRSQESESVSKIKSFMSMSRSKSVAKRNPKSFLLGLESKRQSNNASNNGNKAVVEAVAAENESRPGAAKAKRSTGYSTSKYLKMLLAKKAKQNELGWSTKKKRYSFGRLAKLASPEEKKRMKLQNILKNQKNWTKISEEHHKKVKTLGELMRENRGKNYSENIVNSKADLKLNLEKSEGYRLRNSKEAVIELGKGGKARARQKQRVQTKGILKGLSESFDKSKSKLKEIKIRLNLEKMRKERVKKQGSVGRNRRHRRHSEPVFSEKEEPH